MNLRSGRKTHLKLVFVALATAFALAASFNSDLRGTRVEASAFGPAPTYTGAPMEANCTACHGSFPVNSGTGNVQIAELPRAYAPGQQIPVTVTVNQSDGVVYGFQMTSLDPLGRNAGSYILPTTSPQPLQVDTGFVNGIERKYIEHTINGITPTRFGTNLGNLPGSLPLEKSVRSASMPREMLQIAMAARAAITFTQPLSVCSPGL